MGPSPRSTKRLGLDYIEPELRQGGREIALAEAGELPDLVELGDIRGDLHCHDAVGRSQLAAGDGRSGAGPRLRLPRGHRTTCDVHGFGDDVQPDALKRRIAEVAKLNESPSRGGLTAVGLEINIGTDGSLDYADELVDQLDWVVASVHTSFRVGKAKMTARMVEAVSNPLVDRLGHPSGRPAGAQARALYEFDVEAVIAAAAEHGTMIEINGSPRRRDLNEHHARMAAEAACDDLRQHRRPPDLDPGEHGLVAAARRAGLTKEQVANTRPWRSFNALRKKNRKSRFEALPGLASALGFPRQAAAPGPRAGFPRRASAPGPSTPGRVTRHLRCVFSAYTALNTHQRSEVGPREPAEPRGRTGIRGRVSCRDLLVALADLGRYLGNREQREQGDAAAAVELAAHPGSDLPLDRGLEIEWLGTATTGSTTAADRCSSTLPDAGPAVRGRQARGRPRRPAPARSVLAACSTTSPGSWSATRTSTTRSTWPRWPAALASTPTGRLCWPTFMSLHGLSSQAVEVDPTGPTRSGRSSSASCRACTRSSSSATRSPPTESSPASTSTRSRRRPTAAAGLRDPHHRSTRRRSTTRAAPT